MVYIPTTFKKVQPGTYDRECFWASIQVPTPTSGRGWSRFYFPNLVVLMEQDQSEWLTCTHYFIRIAVTAGLDDPSLASISPTGNFTTGVTAEIRDLLFTDPENWDSFCTTELTSAVFSRFIANIIHTTTTLQLPQGASYEINQLSFAPFLRFDVVCVHYNGTTLPGNVIDPAGVFDLTESLFNGENVVKSITGYAVFN